MTSVSHTNRDILPDLVKPVHYDLSLYDIELGGAFSFQGTVKITAKVLKSTRKIVLNSHQLRIHNSEVLIERPETQKSLHSSDISTGSSKVSQSTGSGLPNVCPQRVVHNKEVLAELVDTEHIWKSSNISYDTPKQRATIEFYEEIPAPKTIVIVMSFQGTMNNEMAGFYRSKYMPAVTPAASVAKDEEVHYMFSTQFESSDARRAFPCFDEPNLKATFDVKIEVPEDQVALSNMPVKTVEKGKAGLNVVSFERTPIMSTYLLSWAVGDFEYVEDFTKRKYNGQQLPVRVYTTKGLKEQGRFALKHAHQIIDYFSEIFKIDFPLPKADMLAVHEFVSGFLIPKRWLHGLLLTMIQSHGAMENWGLITYRTSAILYDEATSSAKYKNRVAYIVAHELAHQWFGNLVTMDWWSELWLNEGFATWVGWLATDKLHPDWNVWPQFVTEGMQTAFRLDALRGSHPIEVPVKDALDVDQIFDAISYLKGSSVIRMLAAHLGLQTFLEGVSGYLKANAYGNATTSDLWSALSDASGQDIHTLMDSWIRKIGYPVLTVAEELGQIEIKQCRYLSTGDVKPEEDETLWWIPLGIKGKIGVTEIASTSLTAKKDTLRDLDDAFYKINVNNTGFYRTNYPPARLASFGKHIDRLSISDKIGLIGDAGALALSGDATTPGLLSFLEGFTLEDNHLVWAQITSSLGTVKSIFSEDEQIVDALKTFTLKLINDAVAKVGWEYHADEVYLKGQLRALLVDTAGMNGNKSVIAEAQRQFELYMSGDKAAIHPSLRLAVFKIAIRYGGASEYEAVKKEWSTTSSIDGKEIALASLGRIQDNKTLLHDYLSFMFSTVAIQDIHTAASALAVNPKTRTGLWEYIKENWLMIREKLGGNMVVLDRFLRLSLDKFTNSEVEHDIARFFEDKDNRGYDRTLGVIRDTIKGRAAYRNRDKEILLEWLKAHQYA